VIGKKLSAFSAMQNVDDARLIIARVAARLPAIFHWPEIAEEGGFAAYGPVLVKSFANSRHARRRTRSRAAAMSHGGCTA
jgi:hypothetical protein